MKKFQALMKSRFENAKKDNKGFSLVELIIAVVILGIIAVVAIGGLYGNVTKSRQNTDVSNAQSIQSALSTLSADKDVYKWAKTATAEVKITWASAQKYDKTDHKFIKSGSTGADATVTGTLTDAINDKIGDILTDGLPAPKAGGSFQIKFVPSTDGNVTITCKVSTESKFDEAKLVQAAE